MQDPSFGVAPQLLPHVHLISDFRFPVHHNLSLEAVVDMLLQAPKIVREIQPMSWAYLSQPPPDGTVFLAWQPQAQRKLIFASDGYSWADPELQYQQEVKGYTVDILVHKNGWIIGKEMATAHTRHRYRITNKHPTLQGQYDPTLWLVHYGSAEPGSRIPISNLPPNPSLMLQQKDRLQLERHGQLARRPFMLHDRQMWPQISMGSGYPQQPPQQPYYRPSGPAIGQPPPKRPRHAGPGQQSGRDARMHPGMGEAIWDEEEAVHHGDALDFLTPRDISMLRYQQHHEWMEEVLSSPYSAHQIIPVDLGLGLTGELAEISDGILNPPDDSFALDPAGKLVTEPGKTSAYTRLKDEQVKEFDQRVSAYITKGEAELEALRSAHTAKMARLRKGKTAYEVAERRLKEIVNAPWGGQDGHGSDPLDDIVKELEQNLGVNIGNRKEVVCISKGGLVEQTPRSSPATNGQHADAGDNALGSVNANGLGRSPGGQSAQATNDGTYNGTPDAGATAQQTSQPESQMPSAAVTPGVGQHDQGEAADFEAGGGDEMQDGLDLLDSMDLDIPDIPEPEQEIDVGDGADADTAADAMKIGDEWVMVENGDGSGAGNGGDADIEAPGNAQVPGDVPAVNTADADTPAAANTGTTPGIFDAIDVGGTGDVNPGGDDDVDEFADFANLDSAGDVLAEFGEAGAGAGAADEVGDADAGGLGDLDFGAADADLPIELEELGAADAGGAAAAATEKVGGEEGGAGEPATAEAQQQQQQQPSEAVETAAGVNTGDAGAAAVAGDRGATGSTAA